MNSPVRVSSPPLRPTLLFDGDCSFCRRSVRWLRKRTHQHVDYLPASDGALLYPEVPADWMDQAVVLILPNGSLETAAAAVFECLWCAGWRLPRWLYRHSRFFARISEYVYRRVAERRKCSLK